MSAHKVTGVRAWGKIAVLIALVLTTLNMTISPISATSSQRPLPAPSGNTPAIVVLPGSGERFYKVLIGQTGMHAITHDMLAAAGLPLSTIDPTTFQLFEQGTEIARRVVDADENGIFSPGDSIVFYGRTLWTEYTSKNIYWLTYGYGPGLPMAERLATPDPGLPQVETFLETLHLEQDAVYTRAIPLTGDADRWHWVRYQTSCSIGVPGSVRMDIATPAVASGTFTAVFTPRLRGFNKNDSTPIQHTAIFDVNGAVIGTATFTNQNEFTGSFSFDQSLLQDGVNTFGLTAPCPTPSTSDIGLINWYDLSYHRTYAAPATGQFKFNVDTAGPVRLTLTGLGGTAVEVYDITDLLHPTLLTGIAPALIASSELALAHTPEEPGRYIATTPAQLLAPEGITPDVPSQLRAPAEGADWIIITPQEFRSEAERLAAHRRLYQHYRTAVVDVQDVYDEFNGGIKDKEAIRAFLRHAYENWPQPAPRFVVLLGDGHYDSRYLLSSTNMVDHIPPYLAAVNPFDGIVAADNRYVAYDPVPPAKNPAPFMHLGRLPANTLADAQAMVDKIIAYETAPVADWNLDVLFIADNADQGGNFPLNSDKVAESSVLPSEYNRQKVYYQVNYANKTDANNAIIDAINQGVLFVNYHGHASTRDWSSEPLLAQSDQARMTNAGMYPVFLPMTCLEGDFINPGSTLQSFGETVVRLPNAGAVASWSPTGKGVAQGHDVIYEAFYAAIFEHGITEIGPATTYAKQVMYDSTSLFKDLIDSYILFGDPATPLALPSADLRLEKQATPEGAWQPGQMVTYTLSYSNAGTVTATDVILADIMPTALTAPSWTAGDPAVTAVPGTTFTWQLPDLIPGASGIITVTAAVAPDAPNDTIIANTATITTTSYERPAHLPDNTATASGTTQPALYLLGGRTFTDANGNRVFDPPDDTPLANVPIEVRDSTGTVVATALSDSQGQWSVNLPAGVYTVVAPATFNGQTVGIENEIEVLLGPGGPGSPVEIPYLAPTGLEIEYFRATRTVSGVRVEWATRVELIVENFDVYRALDPQADPDMRVKVNQTPIPPQAPPGEGAAYQLLDDNAPRAPVVYYWLLIQTTEGTSLWMGPTLAAWRATVLLPLVRR